MSARRWLVRGVVQGVGFRWFVQREAHRIGVRGFVRNLGDGSVEVVADGPAAALEALRERLQRGPPGAGVDAVESAEPDTTPKIPDGFEIH